MTNHNHFPGFLIAIEGIDGSGKTTQAHHVQEVLQARRQTVVRTKEPTTGVWGQQLRDSALTGRLSLQEEVDYFIRDRREHVDTVINPALDKEQIVIADRYYFSSVAYQGARGMDPEEIMRRNEQFAPEPDLLVVLDIDPKLGLERIRMRGDRANHFEKTGTLKKAREIFNSIKKPYMIRLDATQEPQILRDIILSRFSTMYTTSIFRSGKTPEQMLNATLNLFGGDPL